MLVLPKSDSDSYGILHHNKNIPWQANASSNLLTYAHQLKPEYAFGFDVLDWGSDLGDLSPWIEISFTKHLISLSHYSLTSPFNSTVVYFPRCWDVYGKVNGKYLNISSVNESGLNGSLITRVFPVYSNKFFEGFKFQMTCKNYIANDREQPDFWYFRLNRIDFFGFISKQYHPICIHLKRQLVFLCVLLYNNNSY